MKRTGLILISFVILALFTILVGTAAAQNRDIDVDSMSNEEILALLQAIMQKLENDIETDSEKKESETFETAVLAPAETDTGKELSNREPKKFSVYENKKLVVGRLPDYLFIRKQPGGGGGGDDDGGSGDTRTLEFHYGDYTFTIDIPEGEYGEYGIPTDVWKAW